MTNELRELKLLWEAYLDCECHELLCRHRVEFIVKVENTVSHIYGELERKDKQIQELIDTIHKRQAERERMELEIDETYKESVGREFMNLPLSRAVAKVRQRDWIKAEFWENHYSDLWYSEMQGTKKTVEQHMAELEAELKKKLEK